MTGVVVEVAFAPYICLVRVEAASVRIDLSLRSVLLQNALKK